MKTKEAAEKVKEAEKEVVKEEITEDVVSDEIVLSNQEKEIAETMVYCGPTIKGVVQQFAHFNNGLPKKLSEYADKHLAVKRLIVSIDNLIETKKNIALKGTLENVSYNAIKRGE